MNITVGGGSDGTQGGNEKPIPRCGCDRILEKYCSHSPKLNVGRTSVARLNKVLHVFQKFFLRQESVVDED